MPLLLFVLYVSTATAQPPVPGEEDDPSAPPMPGESGEDAGPASPGDEGSSAEAGNATGNTTEGQEASSGEDAGESYSWVDTITISITTVLSLFS